MVILSPAPVIAAKRSYTVLAARLILEAHCDIWGKRLVCNHIQSHKMGINTIEIDNRKRTSGFWTTLAERDFGLTTFRIVIHASALGSTYWGNFSANLSSYESHVEGKPVTETSR